ncbi:MAG: DUF58 domain-containing protein [Pseudomonadota bacterium]
MSATVSPLRRTDAAALRGEAERLAAAQGSLMARAQRLAATVYLGAHGRRRPGVGETFWQYRHASPGDPLGSVDWRRSARSDAVFVRETEWEAAQTVRLWCDRSASMRFRSEGAPVSKADRAAELTAALAILLARGGERTALLSADPKAGAPRPSLGEAHLSRVVDALGRDEAHEFGAPPDLGPARGGRVVFVSDFFGDEAAALGAIDAAVQRGLSGFALQVNDPLEESFPFDGRIVFESMGRSLSYETERASALREDYLAALAARRGRLAEAARRAGWGFATHRTDESAAPALLWLARGLSETTGG